MVTGDDIGAVFGRLTVVGIDWIPNGRKPTRGYRCLCTCGAERTVAPSKLRNGRTTSCGCARGERMVDIGRSRRTHGHNARNSATYRTWMAMIQRCENPQHDAWDRYGGRGISICERWRGDGGFERFLADMGDRPDGLTLDRIDPDGNYEPGNCRWATPLEQRHNRSLAA